MAIDQSSVNQAVLSTASKVADLLFTGAPIPPGPIPSTALDGFDVGAARYVKIRASLDLANAAALLALWAYQPTPGGVLVWSLIELFPASGVPTERRVYIGTATRVAVQSVFLSGRNASVATATVNIYAERPAGA
jgi:hypothetical protein